MIIRRSEKGWRDVKKAEDVTMEASIPEEKYRKREKEGKATDSLYVKKRERKKDN